MNRRRAIRLVLAATATALLLSLAGSYAASLGGVSDRYESGSGSVEPAANTTVVTTSPRSSTDASIVAFAPDGSVAYYNETYDYYFDVDPVPGTTSTVEYVAVDQFGDGCAVESKVESGGTCSRSLVERVNITTGETTRIYSWASRPVGIGGWHDVDRLDESRLVVAGGVNDRVFVVNTTTEVVEWQWDVQSAFDVREGGRFPADWSHLNDVEVLADGRIMVSLRNHDTVVFIDPDRGLLRSQSLGRDDAHSVLYEQHNPDYIPPERGGPAVVVADSENNRAVEYQRTDDGWTRTWTWQDSQAQWVRDADRLPNGHTLVTDSNGNRVLEVDREGRVVWSVPVDTPYEAERLGTGDESTTGQSARELGLDSRSVSASGDAGESASASALDAVARLVKQRLPAVVSNGLLFVLPPWVGVLELVALATLGGLAVVWVGLELYWSAYRLRSPLEGR